MATISLNAQGRYVEKKVTFQVFREHLQNKDQVGCLFL